MKFKEFATHLHLIEQTPSRNQMTVQLADLLKKTSASQAAIVCNIMLGELYPPYHESFFNIAQKSMLPIVASVLGISHDQVMHEVKKVGDVGEVIEKGFWQQAGDEPSITDVYQSLIAIEEVSGLKSQEKKAVLVENLLRSVDPLSAKYIVRIVLGKLRLGFSDMTIIDALSWMVAGDKSLKTIIENAYNICVDLGLIARTLKKDGIDGVKQMSITLGIPIRPAAAERLPTAQEIFEKIGPCSAQPKLDGFRLQIHLDTTANKIFFFSRNLKNMSAMFPDLVQALKKLNVSTLICEGEAIGYDESTHTFLPFQETVKRKRKHDIDKASQEFPLKLFLFDLLYLNGTSMLDVPERQRYAMLKKIVPAENESPLVFIEEKHINSAQELDRYFKEVIAEGLEGLVVKRPDAIYQPGKRNFNWIKLKRTAEGSLEDTIDAVILGYYGGSGRRASFGIGAFLIGVYNKKEDRFETISKVGTGLSDAQWQNLKQQCDEFKVKEQPHNVVCAKELYPDVWITPDIVCEIFADEITRSPLHTAGKTAHKDGLALRFPRFISYREDKSPQDTTSVVELEEMYQHQKK